MRYIEAIKIVQLITKGKIHLVTKEYDKLVNDEYGIDTNNFNAPLMEYLRILLKALQYEYQLDPESDVTYDLYLKLIQIVDSDYDGDQVINSKVQFSNVSDGNVTIIRESAWGSIIGDIIDQLDLINIIDTKITDAESKFGIQDNLGLTDRLIDMENYKFNINNFSEFNTTIGDKASNNHTYSEHYDGGFYWSARKLSGNVMVMKSDEYNGFYARHGTTTKRAHITAQADGGYNGGDPNGLIYFDTTGTIKLRAEDIKLSTISGPDVTIPRPINSGRYLAVSVNGQAADSLGNVTLDITPAYSLTDGRVALSGPSNTLVDDDGLLFDRTSNQLKINTNVVNSNYKLLVGNGALITSGAFAMDEYESYLYMSGGRCAMHVNGNGMRFRLFNNDETNFPDTSKSFSWYNKGFEHMRLWSAATSLNGFGQPATWEFYARINYKVYLPNIPASTGAYKLLTKNDSTGEVQYVDPTTLGNVVDTLQATVNAGGNISYNATFGSVEKMIWTNTGDISMLRVNSSTGTAIRMYADSGTSLYLQPEGFNTNGLLIQSSGAGTGIKILHNDGGDGINLIANGGTTTAFKFTNGSNADGQLLVGNALGYFNPSSKLTVKSSGVININTVPTDYADNAAALAGGKVAGDIYRTGDLLKIVH